MVEERLPVGRARLERGEEAVAGVHEAGGRFGLEGKPSAMVRVGRGVDHRVAQAAGRADDRRGAVAERDHLARAARLEARWHEGTIGAGINPPGEVTVEALDKGEALPAGPPGPE